MDPTPPFLNYAPVDPAAPQRQRDATLLLAFDAGTTVAAAAVALLLLGSPSIWVVIVGTVATAVPLALAMRFGLAVRRAIGEGTGRPAVVARDWRVVAVAGVLDVLASLCAAWFVTRSLAAAHAIVVLAVVPVLTASLLGLHVALAWLLTRPAADR